MNSKLGKINGKRKKRKKQRRKLTNNYRLTEPWKQR